MIKKSEDYHNLTMSDVFNKVPDDISCCKRTDLSSLTDYETIIDHLNQVEIEGIKTPFVESVHSIVYPKLYREFGEIPDQLLSRRMKLTLAAYALPRYFEQYSFEVMPLLMNDAYERAELKGNQWLMDKINYLRKDKMITDYKHIMAELLKSDIKKLRSKKLEHKDIINYFILHESGELLGDDKLKINIDELINGKVLELEKRLHKLYEEFGQISELYSCVTNLSKDKQDFKEIPQVSEMLVEFQNFIEELAPLIHT